MEATFYISTAPTRKIDKRNMLTEIKSINTLKPYENFDVETGYLILTYDEDLVSCNYVKVDDCYYFVKTPVKRVGQQIVLELDKDPLMSNLNEILNMNVIMDRTSSLFNSYISDDRQLGQVNYTAFSWGMGTWHWNNHNIVFVAIGGGTQ